jgi:hypothetical protein
MPGNCPGNGLDDCSWKIHGDFNVIAGSRRRVDHRRAVLCCAVLCCAVLCCAVLCCAVLCQALSRRGCHASALEVTKLLLALDPEDPVGGLLLLDYLALRAGACHKGRGGQGGGGSEEWGGGLLLLDYLALHAGARQGGEGGAGGRGQ